MSPWTGRHFGVGARITLIDQVRLGDGRMFQFAAPHPIALNLAEAVKLRDRALRDRERAIKGAKEQPTGVYLCQRDGLLLDSLIGLTGAVFLSVAAIEALANSAISELSDEATVAVERQDSDVLIPRGEMERRLSLSEKLQLVVPIVAGQASIKGTKAWQKFLRLGKLRNALVHLSKRGYSHDPDEPEAYGQLVRGDADSCVEDAMEIMRTAWPSYPFD